MPAVDSGVGTQITFHTTGFTAELVRVRIPGIGRIAIATSHMATGQPGANQFGNKTFLAARLSDAGQIEMDIHFNPQSNPPIDAVPEAITIDFPTPIGSAIATHWDLYGFVTQFGMALGREEANLGQMTVKISADPEGNGVTAREGTTIFTEGFNYEPPAFSPDAIISEDFDFTPAAENATTYFTEGFNA